MTTRFFFDRKELVGESEEDHRGRLYGCAVCGLQRHVRSPKMKPFGKFRLRIAVVGQAPGGEEDKQGRQFCGRTGTYLASCFRRHGVSMDRDCLLLNAVQCRPMDDQGENRKPNSRELAACFPRLEKQLRKAKPRLIIALGGEAVQQIVRESPGGGFDSLRWRGHIIPSRRWGCWVACLVHPSYVCRMGGDSSDISKFFNRDLVQALKYLRRPLRLPLDEDNGNHLVMNQEKAVSILARMSRSKDPVAFDYETPHLDPWADNAAILTVSLSVNPSEAFCIPVSHSESPWRDHPEKVLDALKGFIRSSTQKIVQNRWMEDLWNRVFLKKKTRNIVADTMLRSHILDGRRGNKSLAFQVFCRYGSTYWKDVDRAKMPDISLEAVSQHTCLDSRYTLRLKCDQDHELAKKKGLRRAARLWEESAPTLIRMQVNGIRVSKKFMTKLEGHLGGVASGIVRKFEGSKAVRRYVKKSGRLPKISSPDDIADLLYGRDGLRIHPFKVTPGGVRPGRPSTDDEVLGVLAEDKSQPAVSFIARLVRRHRLISNKLLGTYVRGIGKHVRQGYLHPFFHIHVARTYRGSSSAPNFQNVPIRKEEARQVRRAFVPRYDALLEADYSGNEVCHLAMHCLDKTLIKFLREGRDFHKEWAAYIYGLALSEVEKEKRDETKGAFVFASFYGREPPAVAKHFSVELEVAEEWQDRLWKQFPGIRVWQEKMVEFYNRHGYVPLLTGFRRYGPLDRNMIINTPVQGSAYHSLQAGLNEAQGRMDKLRMRSLMCAQIHDCGFFDMVDEEIPELVDVVTTALTRVRWRWQEPVPLKVEWKIGRKNWATMMPLEMTK